MSSVDGAAGADGIGRGTAVSLGGDAGGIERGGGGGSIACGSSMSAASAAARARKARSDIGGDEGKTGGAADVGADGGGVADKGFGVMALRAGSGHAG